ncbi:helix-turn-helix domain-containing protein [Alkalihalobacillus sp. BA299]|uniref:helix-turn-helix domain-containing protein n=1 Tax=Alkalihalobacillus sp. BA299 TaxID=2815938 RepID=UPI001AD991CF|nr:helix-turn-helix transcriptional regulator [Alkalihalobacillus sp. BA299]
MKKKITRIKLINRSTSSSEKILETNERNKLKLSTAELAFRPDISRAYLGRIEREEVTASHHIILKIAIALELDINDVYNGTHLMIKRYLKQFSPDE